MTVPELGRGAYESELIASIFGGEWVIGEFVDGSSQTYFMLVSRNFTSEQEAVITFDGNIQNLFEISKTDGAQMPVPGFDPLTRTVILTVSAGDGRLFLVPEPATLGLLLIGGLLALLRRRR